MQYSSDFVWSVNIMCAILVVGVALFLYYIFKYDDWYPNPITITDPEPSDGMAGEAATLRWDATRQQCDDQQLDGQDEAVGVGAINE